jgi:hypothetical protein
MKLLLSIIIIGEEYPYLLMPMKATKLNFVTNSHLIEEINSQSVILYFVLILLKFMGGFVNENIFILLKFMDGFVNENIFMVVFNFKVDIK